MIDKSKTDKALVALHALLIRGRLYAYEISDPSFFREFFDHLEYLPALMLEPNDATDRFEAYLESICLRYDCVYIINKYRKDI